MDEAEMVCNNHVWLFASALPERIQQAIICPKLKTNKLEHKPSTASGGNFFPSPEKFVFCTDTTGSTELLNPVPRQHICDCFEITALIENFVICCNQVTNLSALGTTVPVRLLQAALVILVRLQISQFRSFWKTVLP